MNQQDTLFSINLFQ